MFSLSQLADNLVILVDMFMSVKNLKAALMFCSQLRQMLGKNLKQDIQLAATIAWIESFIQSCIDGSLPNWWTRWRLNKLLQATHKLVTRSEQRHQSLTNQMADLINHATGVGNFPNDRVRGYYSAWLASLQEAPGR